MMEAISLDANITSSAPLRHQLRTADMASVFLSTNMATIVAFLVILSTLLIYSLMLGDVEEKTFEFGMLRSLGFKRRNLVLTITLQAFTFSVPGLLTGVTMAAVLNASVRAILYSIAQNWASYGLSPTSVWIGVIIGIFLPLVSNIVPI